MSVFAFKVNQADQQCTLSEKDAIIEEALKVLKVGDIVDGVVTAVVDFGAFVAVKSGDGVMHGLTGLVHKSELSWDKVITPDAILTVGKDSNVSPLLVFDT